MRFLFPRRKSGFIFSLDAFLAALLLVVGITLVLGISIYPKDTTNIIYYSDDVISVLDTLTVLEVNNTQIWQWYEDGYIQDMNNTVLYQIGELWAKQYDEIAENFTLLVIKTYIPERFGVAVYAESDEIATISPLNESFEKIRQHSLAVAKRSISGIALAKPIEGASASAYLRKITNKKNNEYIYFGGFVGQGNLSFYGLELPSDATVTSILLELDTPGSFDIYFNDVFCDAIVSTQPSTVIDVFNLTSCGSDLYLGQNNTIAFNATGFFNESYVAGGYIRASYKTNQLQEGLNYGNMTYHFPGIDGIANLYDGFYTPGNLTNMSIYLHFKSNYSTYLTVGNRVVYAFDGNDTDQEVYLSDDNLTAFPTLLDFDVLSNGTIPLRFASYNEMTQTVMGNNADVVLITDMSGSMKYRMNSWSIPGNAIPNCKDTDMSSPNSRRLGVAACLDSQFNAIVMNESRPAGNRLWLVDYSTDANPFYSNVASDLNLDDIEDEIYDRYKSKSQHEIKGGTCICCALNMAYDILHSYSNENRTKSVVLLTDGIPSYACGSYFEWSDFNWYSTNGTDYTGDWWAVDSCSGDVSECTGNNCDAPINNAIWSAERIYDDLNATVYAIGMGPIDTCDNANYTLSEIAQAGNGSFIVTQDASALQSFYETIAYEILAKVQQIQQQIDIAGNLTPSVLYSDSYINITYDPLVARYEQNEIALTLESDKFSGCSDVVAIPSGVRVIDAKVVSYSGENWTEYVLVDGNVVYNLSTFSSDYVSVGDPYSIHIPATFLTSGAVHTITIGVADSLKNQSTCSQNNSLIYTGLFSASTGRSDVVAYAHGCNWTVEYDDGTFSSFVIPSDYTGGKNCSYTSTNYTLGTDAYDIEDAYDVAVYSLLEQLDFDDDGRVFVNVDVHDLEIIVNSVSSIPYLWGPSIMEVRVWQ